MRAATAMPCTSSRFRACRGIASGRFSGRAARRAAEMLWPFARRPRARLSVCIVAQDEAAEMPSLLANVHGVADEVIVVDGGSRDATAEIAAAAGARVVRSPWPGHWGAQKNVAFDAASGDWILNIDCDERIGERLRARIP